MCESGIRYKDIWYKGIGDKWQLAADDGIEN
jgi:hypothetical protein